MLIIEINDNAKGNWSASAIAEENRRIIAALNKTAKQATSEIKKDMSQKFTLRNSWTKKGIRSDNATVNNLSSRVYSLDPYLLKQEEGQTWKPDGHVAIPKGARSSDRSLIPRSMFPNALRSRKDVFAFDFSKNASWKPFPHNGIFQRVMNGKHLRILYLLKKEKKTAARWNFGMQVEAVVQEYFDQYYDDDELDNFYWKRESYATNVKW